MNKLEYMIYIFKKNECSISKRFVDETFVFPDSVYNMISLIPNQNSLDIDKLTFYSHHNDKLNIENISLIKFKRYLLVEGNTFLSKLMACISNLDSNTKNSIIASHKKYNNSYNNSIMELRITNSIIINHFILGLVCYIFIINMASKEFNIDKSLVHLGKQKNSIIFSRRYMEFMKLYLESIICLNDLEREMAILSIEFINIWQPFFIESDFEFSEELFANELKASLAVKNVKDTNELLLIIHEEKKNLNIMQDILRELMIDHQGMVICLKNEIKSELKAEIEREVVSEIALQTEQSKKMINDETNIMLNTLNDNFERGFINLQNMLNETFIEISRSNSVLIKDFSEVIECEVSKVIDYLHCKINPDALETSINAIIPIKIDNYLKTLGFRRREKC